LVAASNAVPKSRKEHIMLKAFDEQPVEYTISDFVPSIDGEVSSPRITSCVRHIRGGLPPRVVRRVREHIDANIEQRISVEMLANLANLSVCYFVRAFKQSVGLTPHDFLIHRRVERTKELLSETNLSLSEIALAAGFADQSHCARRFREHVGMSPRDYRWSIP
jgi:AraC family transcriptional regulator